MTISWCLTEMIRYLYYAMNLYNIVSKSLVWCRYSFFLLLYPTGAGSEAMLIYQSLPAAYKWNPSLYWFLIGILVLYVPGKSLKKNEN
jgi:very-long-chain (3R)-3-hydroxyacyl-CoA dehydratase